MNFSTGLLALLALCLAAGVSCDPDKTKAAPPSSAAGSAPSEGTVGSREPREGGAATTESDDTASQQLEALTALVPETIEGWKRTAEVTTGSPSAVGKRFRPRARVNTSYQTTSTEDPTDGSVIIQCRKGSTAYRHAAKNPVGHVEESENIEGLREEWIEVGAYRATQRQRLMRSGDIRSEIFVGLDPECAVIIRTQGGDSPHALSRQLAERLPLDKFSEASAAP